MNELQGFLLEGSGVRGALVRLEETWRQVLAAHNYAQPVRTLLGEGVAATVLLASGLKSRPSVSLQLQGDGPLKLLLIQCTEALRVRGMAQCTSAESAEPLLGRGRLVVNLDTGGAQGLFQGAVPLASATLDGCLEAYFRQSEQLATRLILKTSDERVAGMLLQVLPGRDEDLAADTFEAIAAAAQTVSAAELTSLAADELLPKLFADHSIRVFPPRRVVHDCRCTPERIAGVVRMLGEEEVSSLLAEQGHVELTCEFCNRTFRFDEPEARAILRPVPPSSLLH